MINNLGNLIKYLKEKKWHISFAESLTGGLCASSLVAISGASNVLNEAFVTYSNESKIKYLGVNENTINKYSVFSKEVAYEMAQGLHNITKAQICISTTGIAGPNPEGDLPAGYVCFGIYFNGEIKTYEKTFVNLSRNEVREKAKDYIFGELYKLL